MIDTLRVLIFNGPLTMFLIGLKLAAFITWPWWVVTAPTWGPWALGIVFAIAVVVMAVFGLVLEGWLGDAEKDY